MAMLGKRFQRTVSMSQMGPGSNSPTEKVQVQQQQQLKGEQHAEYKEAQQWEILKNAEAIMMMMASASGANATATAGREHDLGRCSRPTPSPYGLAAGANASAAAAGGEHGLGPCSRTPSPAGLALPDEQLIGSPSNLILSTQYFLDACFFCKRRLRPERDIFIYRGDAAFCTEECRDRQILADQMRSSRTPKKKGGDATSEMALAA